MSRILTIKYEYIFNAQSKTPKHLNGFVAYCMVYDKYFNVANIKYYDAILGIPFIRKNDIILDFLSPGTTHMGNEIILTNKTAFNDKALKEDHDLKVQITSRP